MILADKIIDERKRLGLSQEELAEKLSVSRQAVSKWESAQSTPDLQRVLQMAELFEVSTDYLLKDEIEAPDGRKSDTQGGTDTPVRRVSMEEANDFMRFNREGGKKVAIGVMLCILSPVLLIFLAGLAESGVWNVTKSLAIAIGMALLFLLVAAAVFIFVSYGLASERFKYIEKDVFDTAYGVTGLVKERRAEFEKRFARGIALGVTLCVLSALPLIVAAAMEAPDYVATSLTSLLLIMVAVGVYIMVRVSMIKSGFDMLLREGNYTDIEKKGDKAVEAWCGVYWCVVTAGYLAWSFISRKWDMTWIVWPVAGVLYAAVSGALKAYVRNKERN